jgi:hypothetical protein
LWFGKSIIKTFYLSDLTAREYTLQSYICKAIKTHKDSAGFTSACNTYTSLGVLEELGLVLLRQAGVGGLVINQIAHINFGLLKFGSYYLNFPVHRFQ